MVEEAEEHLDHETRLKNLERSLNDVLFGEERIGIQLALTYLLRLLVEQRAYIIHDRIHNRLQAAMLSNLPPPWKNQASIADAALVKQMDWFKGAIQETDDPASVFTDWLTRLKAVPQLQGFGSDYEVHEADALTPLPPPFRE